MILFAPSAALLASPNTRAMYSSTLIAALILALVAYLCGSVATAIIVSRLMGLPDPRTGGSGNPGATNVLRLGGKRAAGLTLAGDVLKGLLPVLAARVIGHDGLSIAAAALGAFLGHLYPVFFRFRGGKGVATALGALLAASWLLGAALLGTWLAVAAVTRYSSLAAVSAAMTAPFFAYWIAGPELAAAAALIAALLVWRHRGNIARLRAGTEDRIGAKRSHA